ncbi:MAG: extracellular solute-binding protein [Bacilli bacterium]|nr:extracellular solute-binding protein [Bacilli bacterium]
MKNKNAFLMMVLTALSISISGCNQTPTQQPSSFDNPSSEEVSSDSSSLWVSDDLSDYPSISQEIDHTKLIPEDVKNADVSIDFLVYIDGQNGRIPDIGNYSNDPNDTTRKFHPKDVTSLGMAKHFGAASAFKNLCPNVKINLQYCTISDYNELIREYANQKGHLPHLMWGTDHVVEMLGVGYNHDLSEYSDSEYYEQYNEYFMSRFNFGGFQAGLPIAAEPWGVFVNMNDLEEYKIVSDTIADGECTNEYKEWVDNFTWENFVDAARKSNTDTHAGLSKPVEYFTSYSMESINASFIKDGTVDLSSEEVRSTIQRLLEYENEISQYCVYQYNENSFGWWPTPKDYFVNADNWKRIENFCKDQYHTFYPEDPWNLTNIASYIDAHNEKAATDSTMVPLDLRVDFLPYPKVDEDSNAYTGIAVEGLTVGNLCPIGEKDGLPHCYSKDARLEMKVAAYFAMFMGLDPRSIESQAKVKYIMDGKEYTGHLSLPLTKRNSKFEWQENGEIDDVMPDPAINYDDNWQYQLSLWFDVYDLYVTNDEPADVEYFSNVTYGLVQMLDSMYMLDGIGDDYVTCLNYWNEPVNIPYGGDVKDIFDRWQGRFFRFQNEETGDGVLGTPGYVAAVLANLDDMEKEINENSAMAWTFLQECVDTYYYDENFNSLYDVLDKSYRNSYDGCLYA